MSNSVATASKMLMSFYKALEHWHLTLTQDRCRHALRQPHIYACDLICRCMITCMLWGGMHRCVRVGLCYHGINHWSWAGGCCCSLHLSLSAGVRYFTLMIGRTEGSKKVSHAWVAWDGQKNKCAGIAGQRVHYGSVWRHVGERDVLKPSAHIICISAGPVTD